MKKCSMIKKILKILSEKKIYYIFPFLKVSQCKLEQKQTILKLRNPLKSKQKFQISWGTFPLHPLPGLYIEPTGGLMTRSNFLSVYNSKISLSKFVVQTLNKQVGFKALVISKSFSSLLIGCVRRPTPRTDKGSSSITDNMINFNGISVLNFKFKRCYL